MSDDDIDSFLREAARVPSLGPREPDLAEGATLGRHRIVRKLGRGGMGVVYEAEDTELARRVALKVLLETKDDRERRARFLREARAAALLAHPHIATVFDIGETNDGEVFIAMELVRGSSLRAMIDARGALAPDEAVRIAIQIARGLAEAHAAGIVHRDLKPDNVMLDESGAVKIVDFGLAKMTDAGSEGVSTQDGKILGTPSYMAPEQAKSSRVGPPADVFSLGVVLYELLTGKRPFHGDTVVDVLVSVARDEPAPPSKHARAVSRELDRVVSKCLVKDPAARFADAAAVADALESASRAAPRAWKGPLSIAAAVAVVGAIIAMSSQPEPSAKHEPRTASGIAPTALVVPSTSPAVLASVPLPVVTPPRASSAPRPSATTFDPLAHQK